ncbi:hypothetical protein GCM10023321_06320 [Pseudonocardia eucalypti]|uniref:DUF1468 domain-containing protein n=1 Tax=Pseudonocardia eucalypti TaxID=648755 RepID=A0ABP9PNQ8_9PSEU|nr:putative tricarboxylic transport membrane protein [Pseudonocardia eucalypti]
MPESERTTQRATALFALLLLVGAVVMIADGARRPAGGPGLGPGAAPVAIGALLGLVGAGLLVQARAALRFRSPEKPEPEPDSQSGDGMSQISTQSSSAWKSAAGGWWRVGALVAVLLAFAVLLPIVGYVVSSAGLFAAAALLLGAPRSWNVLAYGWAVAAIAFLVFDRLIGLSLPVGPWGF